MKSSEKWQSMVKSRIAELESEKKEIENELKQLRSISGVKSKSPAGSSSGQPRAKRGQRKEEFIKAVDKAGPDGITVAKIAKEIDAQAPGLYPLAKKLVEDKEIVKKDNLYFMPNAKNSSEEKEEKEKQNEE